MRFLQSAGSLISLCAPLWAFVVSAADSNAILTVGSSVPLRILPLGNSITYGFQSTDGNGYRKHLLDKIKTNGTAQYIGSVRSGNMTDNHNEGHSGATIAQISAFSVNSLALRPNLILLMAGTNDMNLNFYMGAPERLASLVDMCSFACPDAVILVAQLTPAANPDVEARVEQFNPSVVNIVASRASRGIKVAAVDMPKFVKVTDLKDILHPNDVGYAKMADAWYEGIQQAASRGWFTPPVVVGGVPVASVGVESASVISSTVTRPFASTTPSVASNFPTSSVLANSSRVMAFTTPMPIILAPTSLSRTTTSLTFSNSSVTVPTHSSFPVVAIASQTATNDAGSPGAMRCSRFASSFAAVGLWASFWGYG